MAAADAGQERPEAARIPPVPGLRVTQAVNNELREMRAADPEKFQAVDGAIRRIPDEEGMPVRIDVPGAPADREYRAILPARSDAPAVIYRKLEPGDDVGGDWLVTTLIDQGEFRDYRQAEVIGILDSPVVNQVAASVAGTVSPMVAGTAYRSGAQGR